MLVAQPSVNGAESANAQGQAIIRTAVKALMAVAGLVGIQYNAESAAILRTIGEKYRLNCCEADRRVSSRGFLNSSLFHKRVRYEPETALDNLKRTEVPVLRPPA